MLESKARFLKTIDSMVSETHKERCRKATGLDFATLPDDEWLTIEGHVNSYLEELEKQTGPIGVRLTGKRVWQTLGSLPDQFFVEYPTLREGLQSMIDNMISRSGRGEPEDYGYTRMTEFNDGRIVVQTTNPIHDYYAMGIFESFINLYKKWPKKFILSKKRPENDYSELIFEF
ncbi:MAG TPA: hypothetical protein PKV16_00990 [Caldisericia bacterium]|nr:hypothetical protein [Caldisericia bacterium]HPF49012.1 hypothetical protein [Caldisericia bacterium]HPI83124.1 hypothetical protein [Caldisericia bacterium]HPQ92351.1 hypothetical protein [Caldisericia bacterium]HRV74551.1 hypothetical protein [Caldisericia bacterium]